MKNKNDNMDKWLHTYTIPALPDEKMENLIENGQNYMDSGDYNRTTLWNIFMSQMQYLPCSFWIIHTLIIAIATLLICQLGELSAPMYYAFTILAIMIPLLVLLSVREISKSTVYDMWEIEQSSRGQLVKITVCRMAIVGLMDIFFLTAMLMLVSHYFQQPLLQIVLYGIVPFNISCICYLRTIMRDEKGEISYHLIVCMLCISALFSLVMRQPAVFESSLLMAWIVLYVISVILLAKTMQKYIQHEKILGEFVWNLQ